MSNNINAHEILAYINENCKENTKIYIGSDSRCFRKDDQYYAEYTIALVVHKNGNNGGKVFCKMVTEPIFDSKKNKPKMRLISEVYKLCEVYLEVAPVLDEYDIEIHLDINKNEKHGSYVALTEAIGIVRGMCGKNPKTKPDAWCATAVAHSLNRITKDAA